MTTPEKNEDKEPQPGDDAAVDSEKKRPETLADFMQLDTFIGIVDGKDDPNYGKYRVSASEHGEEFADMLMEQYRRQQEELGEYLREKKRQTG
ncbi:MAG: hypothetical protein F4W95_05415 [Chloroflexi bacterium]|nr:hypothetical protein [Chloroflexota bacterium]MYD47906.1 hypothetical protein [Chloroflexota bacterium]